MKSKVVSLFDGGGNPPEANYSKLLMELIEPFEEEFSEDFSLEDFIYFGQNAWNFGNMSLVLPPEEFKKILSETFADEHELDLLERMVKQKIEKYKAYEKYIGDYEIELVDGTPVVHVMIEDQEEYLFNMLNEDGSQYEEADYEEGYINRFAIVITPKKRFFDWMIEADPDAITDEDTYTNIYLVDEEIDDLQAWVKQNYDELFELELEKSFVDEINWPEKRNYTLFTEWFEVHYSEMIYDLENTPVLKSE